MDCSRQVSTRLDKDAESWKLDHVSSPLFLRHRNPDITSEAFVDWIAENRSVIDDLVLEHGGVVLRQTPTQNPEEFDTFTDVFPQHGGGYVGGAGPRSAIVGKVWEATKMAPQFKITIHQEMAYMANYPARIAFFCSQPAEKGGETIVASMAEFMKGIPASVMQKLEEHGIRGVRNYSPAHDADGKSTVQHIDEKSWDETFGTDDRNEVEELCRARGMNPIWNDDGTLTLVTYIDAFTRHPILDKLFYRNIIHIDFANTEVGADDEDQKKRLQKQKMPTGYAFGNGDAVTSMEIEELMTALDEVTLAWKWEVGDIMLLDNLQMGHGRNPYEGERETFVVLLGSSDQESKPDSTVEDRQPSTVN